MSLPVDSNSQAVAVVSDSFDLTAGAETTFGKRWGGDVIHLSAGQLAALQAGQTLAVDVQNEYVIFLKAAWQEDASHG